MKSQTKLLAHRILLGALLLTLTSCATFNSQARTTTVTPAGKASLERFIKDADTKDVRENRDIGFGARRVFMQNRGYWITALSFEDRIVAVSVNCNGSRPDAPAEVSVKQALSNAGLPDAGDNLCYYNYVDPEGMKAFDAALAARLGERTGAQANDTLRRAYEALTSPLVQLSYGHACGVAGTKPTGREYMEKLVAANRADLLRDALRGANPEGRIYAAEGLYAIARRTGKPLEASDRKAIDELRALDQPIESCNGCMPETRTAAEILASIEKLYQGKAA